jgi:hypothetical protein
MSVPPFTRLASILWLLVCLWCTSQDDETVREFKKYFRTYKDSPTRVEAVMALDGTESPAVVEALVPVLGDADPLVVDAAVRVLAGFKTRPPIDALLAALGAEKSEAGRLGILRVLAQGKYADVTAGVRECLTDKSWEVRRHAVLALGASGDKALEVEIAPLCQDREPAVKCAALEALAMLHSDSVRAPAMADLEDPVWQVRSAAIAALGVVRHRDSIEPLIHRLEVEEGRLREDVARALDDITGRKFGPRLDLWKQFWESNKDRYQIPTEAELTTLRAKQAERNEQYQLPGATTYHGIATPSRSIVFVIDVSGSMENLVVEKERFEGGDYPSFVRMDIVKTELYRTVERLEPYVKFNVLAFATEVKPWKKTLVPANVLNKSSALGWIQKLEPIGGPSKEDLAQVGLVGSADLDMGKTNTYDALMMALGAAGEGARSKDYQVEVDTIFFLSDGRPTFGRFVDPDDILREVSGANQLRRVVLHTIAIGDFNKHFMERLALDNGGTFVDLGK